MSNAFTIFIFVLLGAWLVIAPTVSLYWYYRPKVFDRVVGKHQILSLGIILITFSSLGAVLFLGLSEVLSFVPENVGNFDKDGDFIPLSNTIAALTSVGITLFVGYVVEKSYRLQREVHSLQLEVDSCKQKINHLER